MDEEAETKAIEKWLRIVDKPLETKEGDKKDAENISLHGQLTVFPMAVNQKNHNELRSFSSAPFSRVFS